MMWRKTLYLEVVVCPSLRVISAVSNGGFFLSEFTCNSLTVVSCSQDSCAATVAEPAVGFIWSQGLRRLTTVFKTVKNQQLHESVHRMMGQR